MNYNPSCQRCSLAKTTTNVCTPGTGSLNAKIVLYGEAPGATEEEGGQSVIGAAGQLLDQALTKAGLTRDDLYISNVVRCRPPENRTPRSEEMKQCRIYTSEELASLNPSVVVTLGGTPLHALTGLTAVGRARGSTAALSAEYRAAVPVVPTFHPAAALHNPGRREEILEALVSDLKTARVLAYGYDEGNTGPKVEVAAPNPEVFKRLARCRELAVDAEWEVFNPNSKKLNGPWMPDSRGRLPQLVSVGAAGRMEDGSILATAIPVGWSEKHDAAMKLLISRVPSIYHFGTADLPWMLNWGADPTISGDTFLLASLLNIDSSLSLEALTSAFTELPPWKDTATGVKGTRPQTKEEWKRLLKYNALDCAATLELHDRLLDEVVKQQRRRMLLLYTKVLLPAIKVFSKASLRGMRLDMAKLRIGRNTLATRIEEVEGQIAEMVGMPDRRDITRGDALAPLVEDLLNVRFPRTPTGKPSMAKDVLLQMQGSHPMVDLLLELSRLRKRHGTYFKPWVEMLERHQTDRLRTIYKVTTARTGRSSAEGEEGGTVQQFPRNASADDYPGLPEFVSEMRDLVIAAPGYKLVLADESQVELRIGATMANERNMIAAYRQGFDNVDGKWVRNGQPLRDLHTNTGGWLKASSQGVTLRQFLDSPETWTSTVTKPERTSAKIPNFGFLYGGAEQVVIDAAFEDYGIRLTWDDAHRMREGYFALYPDLITWHQTVGPRDVERGYCESLLGRRRYVSSMQGEDFNGMVRKMINTPVQALASDLTLAAMVKVDIELTKAGLPAYVIGFVHDSVMVEAREDVVEQVKEIVREAMENPLLDELGLRLPVPLVADVEVGDSWAKAK